MDRLELAKHAEALTGIIWESWIEIYPKLARYDCPRVSMNNRLKTTAGRAILAENIVEYSPEIFGENFAEFASLIIPHELGHFVAHKLYGDCGHGADWHKVMQRYIAANGGTYSRTHPLQTKRIIAKAKARK